MFHMVAEPCVGAEMAHEDEDEIEKQMGSGVDRAERRKYNETMIEQKERIKACEQQAADTPENLCQHPRADGREPQPFGKHRRAEGVLLREEG